MSVTPSWSLQPVLDADGFVTLAALCREYQAHINIDLCFQGFAAELEQLAQLYAAPSGAALIAWQLPARAALGCGALKALAPGVCEMKRLYVRPAHQGSGIGRALALALIERARELGYRRVRLDTLASMQAAQALYANLGFRNIGAYYPNPHPQTRFMELELD